MVATLYETLGKPVAKSSFQKTIASQIPVTILAYSQFKRSSCKCNQVQSCRNKVSETPSATTTFCLPCVNFDLWCRTL